MRASLTQPVFVISVVSELTGLHPQTLRQYERRGLVCPARSRGNDRRYSQADLARLARVCELSNEGVNVAGIARILALEERIAALETALAEREAAPDAPGDAGVAHEDA